MNALHTLFARLRPGRKPEPTPQPVRLSVLALEDRVVPSAPTEMADLARLFPRHPGPTALLVNFDGWSARGIAPFMAGAGNRDQVIQDVLFRVSELFSPFDVQVFRRFGNSNHETTNGATTIFVGDNPANGTGTANRAHAFASGDNSDHPGHPKGVTHRPNSDAFDLAFVDPVFFSTAAQAPATQSARTIAASIAHEAGHTFGLGHVRTDQLMSNPAAGFVRDPVPLPTTDSSGNPTSDNQGTVIDIMSYTDANRFFSDLSLPLTAFNFDGTRTALDERVVPKWHVAVSRPGSPPLIVPYRMQTQNSFAYLRAALGPRADDDFQNVVHDETVAHFTDTAPRVARGSLLTGRIERHGDFDVFQFTPGVKQTLTVSTLRKPGGATFNTAVQIYQGQSLVAFNNDRTATDIYSQVTHTFLAGVTYSIVVGAAGGRGVGDYRLWVAAPGDPNPDFRPGPRVAHTEVQYAPRTGVPTGILVTFAAEIDPSTFSASDVALVGATGVVRRPSSITPTGIPNRQFLLRFGVMPRGDHTLTIGPNVADFAGNLMNQDGDAVNGEAAQDAYAELVDLSPLDIDPFDP